MQQAINVMRISPEDYLAFEREAQARHEYVDGEVVAMAGGSREHSLLASNLIRLLGNALHGQPCDVFTSDMRVKAAARYTYPDLSVACGQQLFEDGKRDTLLNPILICEVLSDSTEAHDRGDKFASYQQIESLRHYVLVSQKEARIEHFARQASRWPQDQGEQWLLRVLGPGQTLVLSDLKCEIAVDEIYLAVFEARQDDPIRPPPGASLPPGRRDDSAPS